MLDKKVVYDKQDKSSSVYGAIHEAIDQKVANNIIGVTTWTKDAVFSHDFTFDINVRIECVSAKPKRRRTPEEVAEVRRLEAEERSQRLSQRLLWEKQAQEQKELEKKRLRLRVHNQIDHAFRSGSDYGTEPAARYITCHCNAPATFLLLDRPIPPGATVLNEEGIVDAVCDQHHVPQGYGWRGVAEGIACSRLEFFYAGVRQISIKKEGTN